MCIPNKTMACRQQWFDIYSEAFVSVNVVLDHGIHGFRNT